MTRHNCEEWIADGMGCANCNATAGAVRHYWNDPVREERDELRVQVKSLTARLAAQSGYVENEEQADLQAVKKEAWEAGAQWMLQRFLEIPASVRAGLEAKDGHFLTYMGKSLSYHAEQYALPNHDPRKGAE